jgi:hypothetical protein
MIKMNFNYIGLIAIAIVIFQQQLKAQVLSTEYQFDTEFKSIIGINTCVTYEDGFLLGVITYDSGMQPNIIRIDSLGNEIWRTSQNDFTYYLQNMSVNNITVIGDEIYATVSNESKFRIWKVNPINGQLLWVNDLNHMGRVNIFENSNEAILAVDYFSGNANGLLINKSNGTIISQSQLFASTTSYAYCVTTDSEHNIYHGLGNTIVKRSGQFPFEVIWTNEITSPLVSGVNDLFIQSSTSLFASVNVGSTLTLLNINPGNGSITWSTFGTNSAKPTVEYGDFAYYLKTIGTLLITKIQKSTGAIVTSFTVEHPDPVYNSHGPIAGKDLTTDVDGNLILNARWSDYLNASTPKYNELYFKINPDNGSIISQTIIEYDILYGTGFSYGKLFRIGERVLAFTPMLIPSVDETHFVTNLSMVDLLDVNGVYEIVAAYSSTRKFSSKIVDSCKIGGSKTAVLAEYGRAGEISLYDENNQLMWRQYRYNNDKFHAHSIQEGSDGTIYIYGQSDYYTFESSEVWHDDSPCLDVWQFNVAGEELLHVDVYLDTYVDFVEPYALIPMNGTLIMCYLEPASFSSELILKVYHWIDNQNHDYHDLVIIDDADYSFTNFDNLNIQKYSETLFFAVAQNQIYVIDVNNWSVNPFGTGGWVKGFNNINSIVKYSDTQYILSGTGSVGNQSNLFKIGMIDFAMEDTLWTRSFPNNSTLNHSYGLTLSEDHSKLFATSGSRVGCYDMDNHAAFLWNNAMSNSFGLTYADGAYDNTRDWFWLVGKSDNNGESAKIIAYDSTGVKVLDTEIYGETNGSSYCTSVTCNDNGTVFIGGSLYKNLTKMNSVLWKYSGINLLFDVDDNNIINTTDLEIIINNYGCSTDLCSVYDLNQDGIVNAQDLMIVVSMVSD